MPLTKSAAILEKNPDVVTSKRGVDAYGLYFETVEVGASGRVTWYTRVFLADQTCSVYRRASGMSRTTWKLYTFPSVEAAEKAAKRYVISGIMRGAPVLVQLEPVDIGAISDKKMPGARYRGNTTHESRWGKLEEGHKIRPAAMQMGGFDAVVLLDASKSATTPPTPTSVTGEPY